ncbi:MAG TPA: transcription antitermination factor NusB [Verrucomicrobiota bacterium]|jgi:N utilization substance protein B|nr:transcription antitermination factor NusB [Verrucomicrobiota bacterium]
MNNRRLARERAVQFLYQLDLNSSKEVEEELRSFWDVHRVGAFYDDKAKAIWASKSEQELPPPTLQDLAAKDFMESLVKGVLEHLDELDRTIAQCAKNWNLRRMAAVDRNILRLAAYEIKYRNDIPPVVSINEAVDIAKKYSTEDSGKFVNGILDKVRSDTLRPSRQSVEE